MTLWRYRQDQEDPAWATTWNEWVLVDGRMVEQPKDLSDFDSFELELVNIVTKEVGLTKTTNITGGAAELNVIAAWGAGEFATVTPGQYHPHVRATKDGRDSMMPRPEADVIEIYAAPA